MPFSEMSKVLEFCVCIYWSFVPGFDLALSFGLGMVLTSHGLCFFPTETR